MSIAITQVNAAADTFGVWLTRTNLVINAISTTVLTVNTSASGDITTGNGYVNGIFSSVIFATNTLRGGNVATTGVLSIVSNTYITNSSSLFVGNSTVNATMNSTVLSIASINVTSFTATSGTFPAGVVMGNTTIIPISTTLTSNAVGVVDSFLLATARSAEYTVTVKDNNSNAYQISKILLIHDGGNALSTEFGIVTTNGSIGVWSASINSTATILNFDPNTSNNVTIKGTRNTVTLV